MKIKNFISSVIQKYTSSRASVVVQRVKLLLVSLASHIAVQVLAALLLVQLYGKGPVKAANGDLGTWAPLPKWENSWSSWLLASAWFSTAALAVRKGTSGWKNLFIFLSLPLYSSFSNKINL